MEHWLTSTWQGILLLGALGVIPGYYLLRVFRWCLRKVGLKAAIVALLFSLRTVVTSFLITKKCSESKSQQAQTALLVFAMLLVGSIFATSTGLILFGIATFFYFKMYGAHLTLASFILSMFTVGYLLGFVRDLLGFFGLWVYLDMHNVWADVRKLTKDKGFVVGFFKYYVTPHLTMDKDNKNASPSSMPPSAPPPATPPPQATPQLAPPPQSEPKG